MSVTDEFRETEIGCRARSSVTARDRIGRPRRRPSRSERSGPRVRVRVRARVPASVGRLAVAVAVGRLAVDAEAGPAYTAGFDPKMMNAEL